MTKQAKQSATKKVKLFQEKGDTSRYIDAEIRENGDLVLSGQDVGRAPEEFWGDSDYEWWVSVAADYKDDILLALLETLYGGKASATQEFRELLETRGIPSQFDSWG